MNTKWFDAKFSDIEDIIIDYRYDENVTFSEVTDAINALILQAQLDRTREIIEALNSDLDHKVAASFVLWEFGNRYPDEVALAVDNSTTKGYYGLA